MCSSQSFAPVESPHPHYTVIRFPWRESDGTLSLYLLSTSSLCHSTGLLFLSCRHITHSYGTDVWRAVGEKPPPRGLLSIQGHRLTKWTLQRGMWCFVIFDALPSKSDSVCLCVFICVCVWSLQNSMTCVLNYQTNWYGSGCILIIIV